MISMDKTYRTRDGRDVRLLCVDRKGAYPVVGLVNDVVTSWASSGKYVETAQYAVDLIEVVPDVVRWANVYSTCVMTMGYPTREDADRYSDPKNTRIAILKITTKNKGANGASDVSVEVLAVGGA